MRGRNVWAHSLTEIGPRRVCWETVLCEPRGQRRVLGMATVRRFDLGRRSIPGRLEAPAVVEPVDPFERCELHRSRALPRTLGSNHLGRVQLVD